MKTQKQIDDETVAIVKELQMRVAVLERQIIRLRHEQERLKK